MTVGPWRPIYLKTYTASISDLQVTPEVDSELRKSISACIRFAGVLSKARVFTVSLLDASGNAIRTESRELTHSELEMNEASVMWVLEDSQVDLWWPIKYGAQTMYTFEVKLQSKVSRLPSYPFPQLMHFSPARF